MSGHKCMSFLSRTWGCCGERRLYMVRNEIGAGADREDYGQARRQSGMCRCAVHRKWGVSVCCAQEVTPTLLQEHVHSAPQVHLLDCCALPNILGAAGQLQ